MTLEDVEKIGNILQDEFDDFWNTNILKEEILKEACKYLVAKDEERNNFRVCGNFNESRYCRGYEYCCSQILSSSRNWRKAVKGIDKAGRRNKFGDFEFGSKLQQYSCDKFVPKAWISKNSEQEKNITTIQMMRLLCKQHYKKGKNLYCRVVKKNIIIVAK